MRRALRLLSITVTWAALSLAAGVALFVTAPSLVGYRSLTVLTGSMRPTVDPGDAVVDEVIRPLDARVGDIVTFPDPEHRGRLTTHRLRGITVRGRRAYMVTRGDANDTVERWNVALASEIGRVAARPISPETSVRASCVLLPKPRESLTPWKPGAGEGIRTLDPNLGKVVLRPLSPRDGHSQRL